MDWNSILFGALLGFFVSILANRATEKALFYWNKLRLFFLKETKCRIFINNPIFEQENNAYYVVNSFDKSISEFSNIASEYLDEFEKSIKDDNRSSKIIITNVQQPKWYFEKFKEVHGEKSDFVIEMKNLENNCQKKDIEAIKTSLNKLSELYYTGNKATLYGHQWKIGNSNMTCVDRINLFKIDVNSSNGKFQTTTKEADTANKKFKKENKLFHLLFFEKIFGKNVINYNVSPFEVYTMKDKETYADFIKYSINDNIGGDSLIINNKKVLSYDEEFNCLTFQTIPKRDMKSFFKYITNTGLKKQKLRCLFQDYGLKENEIEKIFNEEG